MSFDVYTPPSPLAKQWPKPIASYPAPATIKRRGITVISPQTMNAPISYSEAPIQDGFTVYWDQPDFNEKKLQPRYDGYAHLLPKGAGRTIRQGK